MQQLEKLNIPNYNHLEYPKSIDNPYINPIKVNSEFLYKEVNSNNKNDMMPIYIGIKLEQYDNLELKNDNIFINNKPAYINLKYNYDTFTIFLNKLMKDYNLYDICNICYKKNIKCRHYLLDKCNRKNKCTFCHCF